MTNEYASHVENLRERFNRTLRVAQNHAKRREIYGDVLERDNYGYSDANRIAMSRDPVAQTLSDLSGALGEAHFMEKEQRKVHSLYCDIVRRQMQEGVYTSILEGTNPEVNEIRALLDSRNGSARKIA